MSLFRNFINMILPPRCLKCGQVLGAQNGLCADCFKKISFIGEPLCYRCGRPFAAEMHLRSGVRLLCGACGKEKRPLFAMRRSAFLYNDESKKLILDFKFKDKTFSAETLANILYGAGRDIWPENPDVIIPVPIHWTRLLKRRYNQSALLVKYLSSRSAVSADYSSLVRQKNTVPQVQLVGAARRRNLLQAFAVKYPQNIKGKKIVLVDDVETTGSTLKECAKVLKKAGAAKIYALTLARTEN
ncbi:MAG: ComF family protein [Alphaproteobacteria bacterium]|nr:ComF family protein [Alphaproteobacteria bacterium]